MSLYSLLGVKTWICSIFIWEVSFSHVQTWDALLGPVSITEQNFGWLIYIFFFFFILIDFLSRLCGGLLFIRRSGKNKVLSRTSSRLIHHDNVTIPSPFSRLAGYVEALASRLGMQIPDLSPKQADMWQTRVSSHSVRISIIIRSNSQICSVAVVIEQTLTSHSCV